MQLKQLKLAGFKSFVEPTTVPFPGQLVAVVGPNGCGKSNIIDAVRWVLGESSAKTLRGESMTDVIFKGSSQRKPVGQASVELVFDNSLGRLTGQYASYQEISVKRLVTRDGDSFYFLNGTRCRRRDINDIFLGTGAGARGYSIIGQDMISRLIEARPDDLRLYLEEAAGVSKYKERRRETLQRIGHTRENLERVADIRDELDKQLARLERQAKAAERFKMLKEQERLYKADILALKWQGISSQQTVIQQELTQLLLQSEQQQAKISNLLKDEVLLNDQLQEATDELGQRQTALYQLGTEIARLEEAAQQKQREKQRLELNHQQVQAEWQNALNQVQQDTEAVHDNEQSLQVLHARLQTLRTEFAEQQRLLQEKQQQEISWNSQWQQVQATLNQLLREKQVEQVRLQHLEERRHHTLLRLDKVNDEQATLQLTNVQKELAALEADYITLSQQYAIDEQNLQRTVHEGKAIRQQVLTIEQQLHQQQDKVQTLAMEHGVLLAAQQAALQTVNESVVLPQWEKTARLLEVMTVPEHWLGACELVLGESVHAILLDSMDDLWPELPSLQGSSAIFVTKAAAITATGYPRLSDKISGVLPCWLNALDNVFAADSLQEALAWLPTLQAQQSVITADGYWLGCGWVRVASVSHHDDDSVLSRQQTLVKLKDTLQLAQDHLRVLQTNRDQFHGLLTKNASEQDRLKQVLSTSGDCLRSGENRLNNTRKTVENSLTRTAALTEECEELQDLVETLAADHLQSEHKLHVATANLAQSEQQQNQLMATKSQWDGVLVSCRQQVDKVRTDIHQNELHYDRETLKSQQLQTNIQREQVRIAALQERLVVLANQLLELVDPEGVNNPSLTQKMQEYQQVEELLAQGRQGVEALQSKQHENQRNGKQQEQVLKSLQEKIQQQQMQEQAQAIHANNMADALAELNAQPQELLANMASDVTLQQREQAWVETEEKIKRLGAINLVAIEEYQTEQQRKRHLDEQYLDLTEALAILDSAIAKMDKETQLRLQDTFDQINASFQSLFPRLFGGGRALLTLTCDNLLEAGILVMAQPPGKRNSSIHMLSGGEKAMTAVALVFAIFQLNPSPFCMLDEVDAPLDDVNVRRFCDLVKEMSQFVQFLFITHNKVTMELADHLIGVTMREPGVSRIVAVDVEQALSIAE